MGLPSGTPSGIPGLPGSPGSSEPGTPYPPGSPPQSRTWRPPGSPGYFVPAMPGVHARAVVVSAYSAREARTLAFAEHSARARWSELRTHGSDGQASAGEPAPASKGRAAPRRNTAPLEGRIAALEKEVRRLTAALRQTQPHRGQHRQVIATETGFTQTFRDDTDDT